MHESKTLPILTNAWSVNSETLLFLAFCLTLLQRVTEHPGAARKCLLLHDEEWLTDQVASILCTFSWFLWPIFNAKIGQRNINFYLSTKFYPLFNGRRSRWTCWFLLLFFFSKISPTFSLLIVILSNSEWNSKSTIIMYCNYITTNQNTYENELSVFPTIDNTIYWLDRLKHYT